MMQHTMVVSSSSSAYMILVSIEVSVAPSVQSSDSPGGHAGVAGAGAALADGARGGPEAAGGGAAQGDDGAHHEADQELGGQQQAKSDMK